MSLGSSTVVSSPDVAVEAMPLAIQLIPRTACLFFPIPGIWPVLSVLMSPLPRVALSIWFWPWCIRFSLFLSLSLCLPPGFLTSLYFSLTPPLFNLFLFHPTLFCYPTPLAQPSFPSVNFCSTPRGAVAEQQYQTLSDIWMNAAAQSRVTSPRQQSSNDA